MKLNVFNKNRILLSLIVLGLFVFSEQAEAQQSVSTEKKSLKLKQVKGKKQRNIIFILTDDHRYDFMGFTGKVPWLKTPNLDRLASEGAHMKNAFVTTSLCSPSRASILTGQYSHVHKIVDNVAPNPRKLNVFSSIFTKSRISNFIFWEMAYGRS